MSLKAEVYQFRWSQRWAFYVYDTENPGEVLAHGRYPKGQWVAALLDAQSAIQRLHLKAFQDRVGETVRKLADISAFGTPRLTYRVGINPAKWQAATRPPEPKTWEGDYA